MAWVQGLWVAIPKGGKDIRPITIEPVFAKVFETILDNRKSTVNEVLIRLINIMVVSLVLNGGFP